MKSSQNKQHVRFKLCAVVNSMMTSHAIIPLRSLNKGIIPLSRVAMPYILPAW